MDSIEGKRVMHIDTSGKFYEKKNSGVAYKIVKTNEHKGIVISNKMKRDLDRGMNADGDYPRLYAIVIYKLIKENLNDFDVLVICEDEHYVYVREYLDLLCQGNESYLSKKVMCIEELRELTGNPKLKSYADGIANIYRKKGLKSIQRRQKGIRLNLIALNYKQICDIWLRIEKALKDKV
jgi:hypothetical protein